jgi:hypothetical protein
MTYLPMKMEQAECTETSAYKIQTPGNYSEENKTYRTRRKFEIKNARLLSTVVLCFVTATCFGGGTQPSSGSLHTSIQNWLNCSTLPQQHI